MTALFVLFCVWGVVMIRYIDMIEDTGLRLRIGLVHLGWFFYLMWYFLHTGAFRA